ncbi:hypothetical protein XM38_032830 [Halomicronema hongdechloris C2206]|uniref:Uncharacterized protein n=1 Tax=Halomicronema hongdechloris C2206 TaxID=1641165 RepID=A0A1Z3HPZ4_9CYAN|nr:hypothetical protein [Halomicronema hongdechloris]ASC72326.1 hypothetical protein XM38_032830 [Halomicronema hongdechloris C2206]
MASVQLAIETPKDGDRFSGNAPITFRGSITELPTELAGVPLYYRWFSSLFPAAEDRYSINPTALSDPTQTYNPTTDGFTPGPGTHVITLGVSDQAGEDQAAQNATQHGGVTGGAAGAGKCVVHVLKANSITPQSGGSLSRTQGRLEAEAPLHWGRLKSGSTDEFELNPDYHQLNRLRYRWRFEIRDRSGNAVVIPFEPKFQDLAFDIKNSLPVVRYEGPLPLTQDGPYTLTLRVEDMEVASFGHDVTLSITVGR